MNTEKGKKISTLLADAGLLYAAAIWGSTFIVVKDTLSSVHPMMLLAQRFLLASALMMIPMLFMGKKVFHKFGRGFLLGLILWCLYAPQTTGLLFTSASNSGFLTGLFVVFLPILYFVFYKKVPSFLRLVSAGISLIGLWILTGGLVDINTGDLLTIFSAIFYALHILVADKNMKEGIDPYILSFQQFFSVGVLSLVSGLILGQPLFQGTVQSFLSISFLAVFPTLSAFVIQLIAQKKTAPMKVSLIFATEPLFAAIFAWTMGGETCYPMRALGGFLIVIAIILYDLTPLASKNKIKENSD